MTTFIGNDSGPLEDDEYFSGSDNILYGLGGNDILAPDAPGSLIIYGGEDDDVLAGLADDDELYGGRGNDELFGEQGDDLLEGGSGNDTVGGGAGSDLLYGGRGADIFYFLGDFGKDRVQDFNRTEGDSVLLSIDSFPALNAGEPLDPDFFFKGKNAQDADDHVGYDQASGKLYYDKNGDDSGGRYLFAQFDKGTKLKASDIAVDNIGLG